MATFLSLLISGLALLVAILSYIRAGRSDRIERIIRLEQKKQEIILTMFNDIIDLKLVRELIPKNDNFSAEITEIHNLIDENINDLKINKDKLENWHMPDISSSEINIILEEVNSKSLQCRAYTKDIERRVQRINET